MACLPPAPSLPLPPPSTLPSAFHLPSLPFPSLPGTLLSSAGQAGLLRPPSQLLSRDTLPRSPPLPCPCFLLLGCFSRRRHGSWSSPLWSELFTLSSLPSCRLQSRWPSPLGFLPASRPGPRPPLPHLHSTHASSTSSSSLNTSLGNPKTTASPSLHLCSVLGCCSPSCSPSPCWGASTSTSAHLLTAVLSQPPAPAPPPSHSVVSAQLWARGGWRQDIWVPGPPCVCLLCDHYLFTSLSLMALMHNSTVPDLSSSIKKTKVPPLLHPSLFPSFPPLFC